MRGYEDYSLWLRLAVLGSFIYSPDTLVSYRQHALQGSRQHQYAMHEARARLRALHAIHDAMRSSKDVELKRMYDWILAESLVRGSWATRKMGDHAEARRTAAAAIALRPSSIRAWRALLASLVP